MRKPFQRKILLQNIKQLIQQAQAQVVRNVNTTMLITYFEIGRMIVEHEQKGKQRAEYAKETLKSISIYLSKEFGKGYSRSNLEYMRNFYLLYNLRIPVKTGLTKSQSLIGKSPNTSKAKSQPLMRKSDISFQLSWTHYIHLMKIQDEKERNFYQIEV